MQPIPGVEVATDRAAGTTLPPVVYGLGTSRAGGWRPLHCCPALHHLRLLESHQILSDSDALDLPLERDARGLLHALAHGLAERLDVGGGGGAKIDQEIAVQLRD